MTADIDVSNLPVIDAHCHSYLESPKVLSGSEFARLASLAAQPNFLEGKFVPHRTQLQRSIGRLSEMYEQQPYFRHMVYLLSKFFGCENSLVSVSKARSKRARAFRKYVKDLFDDTGIKGLVMDGGYPALEQEDLKQFPATVAKIFRLETFVKDLLARHKDFEELCATFESGIREAVKNDGYVGLKSIIAYRTGLKIRRVDRTEAQEDFERISLGRAEMAWFGPKVKNLRDFLFVKALELSIKLNVPMQVHTGVGDYDIVLDQCDPALLYELLKDEELRHATVVLVHSGYPNNSNAAYMTSMLPNVFLDFSLTVPFLILVDYARLLEIIQVAPSFKIMYGSDGFNLPELIWFGSKLGKRALSKCLSDCVAGELFDEDEAIRVGKRILFENASKLYGLRPI